MIRIRTTNPRQLSERIRQAVDEGRASNWHVDNDGDYYLTRTELWGMAWMRPRFNNAEADTLYFGILEPKDQKLKKRTYAVYHCRFAEFLLSLFDNEINSLEISSMLDPTYDIYSHT